MDLDRRRRAVAGVSCLHPALSGIDKRRHPANLWNGLDTHVADIVNVIDFYELSDVVLVGRGPSGVAVAGAADARRERTDYIVFFDALIPHAGRLARWK